MGSQLIRQPNKGRTATITLKQPNSNQYADFICSNSGTNQTDISNAIVAASALTDGADLVLRAGARYTITDSIIPKSNVRVLGETGAVIQSNANKYIFQNDSNALTNFTLENITFEGDRTTNHAAGAIFLDGSLNPNTVGAPLISNFVMRNCRVRNCWSLPIKIFGVDGKSTVTNCEFYQCLDAGFIYDSEVIFNSNYSYGSGDNGFSISRGCKTISCVGNTIENPTLYGLWMSGFLGEAGPTQFTCNGNTVINARRSGIALIGSPSKGSITGNTIDNKHNRPVDDYVDGIQIYGDNSSQYADMLTVSGNTIMNAARSGISLSNAHNMLITSNNIIDIGTQFKADGSTAIGSTDTTTNVGILTTNLGSYSNIWINGNAVYDQRATPYCNYDYYKVGTAGVNYGTGETVGTRNASQLPFTMTKASNQLTIFTFNGGVRIKRTTVADIAYSILATDNIVAYTTLTAGRTTTLPSASAVSGQIITVKDETGNAGTSNITIATVSSQTIDGAATYVINANYGVIKLYNNGINWYTK